MFVSQEPADCDGLVVGFGPGDGCLRAETRRWRYELVHQELRVGHGEAIPARYTCDGEDVSPPLTWGEIPSGAKTLALIMDDPDAPVGTWDHWILYNIPVNLEGLPENYPAVGETPNGTRSGRNSWGRLGYGGPCPPSGTHRYFFRLYALDRKLDLAPGATSGQVRAAMSGSILAEAELYGTYRRARGR